MAPLLTFNVLGTPAPQGSKIARINKKTGQAYVQEQNAEAQKNWRQDVLAAASIARNAGGLETLDGPVWVDIEFRLPRPASVNIRKRPYPCVKPDGDKLQRNTWDALVQAGVIRDDALIVNWRASKRYATDDPLGSPGATIRVGLVPLPEII
jgi:Holliday junction resolvase RusA-like endonuclease